MVGCVFRTLKSWYQAVYQWFNHILSLSKTHDNSAVISSVGGFESAAVLLVCVNSGMSIDHCCVLCLFCFLQVRLFSFFELFFVLDLVSHIFSFKNHLIWISCYGRLSTEMHFSSSAFHSRITQYFYILSCLYPPTFKVCECYFIQPALN